MKTGLRRVIILFLALLVLIQGNLFTPKFEGTAYALQERRADIVFVVDTTGSMGSVIDNVKQNINTFVDVLSSNNISARLGLVTFKDIYEDGMYSTSNYGWFADSNAFKSALGGVSVGGGGDSPESAVDGLEEARRMTYQQLSKKFIILVTDVDYKEGTHYDTPGDAISMSMEINKLKTDNIVTSVVSDSYYQGAYIPLYTSNNGVFSNISTAFSSNLHELTNMINANAAPAMSVVAPVQNQIFGAAGSSLIPKISVSDANGDTLTGKYYLDGEAAPRDTQSVTNTLSSQIMTFSSLPFSGLSQGGHTITFELTDHWANPITQTVNFQVDQTPPNFVSKNISSTETTITATESAVDSTAGLDSAPYRITIGSLSSGWTANSSFTSTALLPNTAYNVKLEARDKIGNIAIFEQLQYTKAQVPVLSVQQSTETTLKAGITDQNPGGTKYVLRLGSQYVSADGTLVSAPVWITPESKSVLIKGLTPGSSYALSGKAQNNQGVETAFSANITGTALAAPPASLTAELHQQSIKISWPQVSGALRYDIETDGVVINNGLSTTYEHTGLSPVTQHSYRVRIINAGGTGNWGTVFTRQTLPNPPEIPDELAATSTQTEISLNWNLTARATYYEIEMDGSVKNVGNVNAFTFMGLEPLTEYKFRVRAGNTGGTSDWSSVFNKKTLPVPPQTPTRMNASPAIHSVSVSWDNMDGATGYEIEVDGLIVENDDQVKYTHEGLDALSGHTYRVRAKNIGGKSPWSAPVDVTTLPEKPSVPSNIISTSTDSQINAVWYLVPHTDNYEIEMDGSKVVSVTNNSFVHDQLAPDSKHVYRIRAKNISGYSEWSKPVTMSTMPQGTSAMSLTNVAAVVTNKSIMLSWETVAPDARYDIEVDGVIQDNGQDTIFQHSGLAANEFHTYKIRLKDSKGVADWVAVISLSTLPDLPNAPSKVQANAKDTSIELHWDKVEGAMDYELEIDGVSVDLGEQTTYIHGNLPSGTVHTYRVRAKNITGVTVWSPSIQQSTTNPDFTVQLEKDKILDLSLIASNVQDFSELTFVVTYDPEQLEVYDLFDFTPKKDQITSGTIEGSNLSVTYSPGKITFKVNQNVVPGTSWSGEVTTILLKGKNNGIATINVKAE